MEKKLDNEKLNKYRFVFTLKKYYLDALRMREIRLASDIKVLMDKYRVKLGE